MGGGSRVPFLLAGLAVVGLPVGACAADSDAVLKKLKPADGYSVSVFAEDLPDARLMVRTDTGDIIVSLRGPDKVVLLPVSGKTVGEQITLLSGLDRPHGLVLHDGFLYVAEETRVVRYKFDAKARKLTGKGQEMFDDMPSGGHSTRTIRKGPDGWFYVSVGSSCNVCIEDNDWRATMLRFKPGSEPEVFATGLRNTVGYDWHPGTATLYSVDNGRDMLGDNIPPGEVNALVKGGFYGWPYFYGNNVKDPDVGDRHDEAKHGKPIAPAHAFNAHVAPLSLRFLSKAQDGAAATALVGQHGSWNRSSKIGYKVVKLSFAKDGVIKQSDFLSGFLQGETTIGRPVDTLELPDGRILVTDDENGMIWQMTPKTK